MPSIVGSAPKILKNSDILSPNSEAILVQFALRNKPFLWLNLIDCSNSSKASADNLDNTPSLRALNVIQADLLRTNSLEVTPIAVYSSKDLAKAMSLL